MVLKNIAGGINGVTGGVNGVSMKKRKITKGRKKIEIKKIEETNSRQVTFSKRRTGLFKKASELCVLTGAHVAVLVSSPGGRVFAFGHPNVDVLVDRYLKTIDHEFTTTTATASSSSSGGGGGDGGFVGGATAAERAEYYSPPPLPLLPTKEFNRHYVEVSRELELEKKRREMIPASGGGGGGVWWFNNDVEGMEAEEMEEFLVSLVGLKKKVVTRADELMTINKAPAMIGCLNGYDVAGWSGFDGGQTVGVPANGGVYGGFGSGTVERLGGFRFGY